MEAAEEHRRHQSKWFFDCDSTMHRKIAAAYLADPRYLEKEEARQPGLAQYMHDAIKANAQRATGE